MKKYKSEFENTESVFTIILSVVACVLIAGLLVVDLVGAHHLRP